MISRGIKFYVYFVISSFIVLWLQLAQIVLKVSPEYAFESSQSLVFTATEYMQMTENAQINMVGVLSWCIVGAGFFGVIVTMFLLAPWRRAARSRSRYGLRNLSGGYTSGYSKGYSNKGVYSGARRNSSSKSRYTAYNQPIYKEVTRQAKAESRAIKKPEANSYYYKYGRNIETRRYN